MNARIGKRHLQRLALLLVVEVVLGGAALYLANRHRAAREEELLAAQAALAQAKSDAGELNSLLVTVAALSRELRHLEHPPVPEADYLPSLMLQLYSLAHRSGIQMTSYQPAGSAPQPAAAKGSEKTAAPTVPSREVTIAVAGNFQQHMAFLRGLAQFPKIVTIKPADLRRAGTDASGHPVMNVQLKLTCYVLPQEGA